MAITGTQISDRVGILLNDTTSVRWTAAERLMWINDGRREAFGVKPSIFGSGTKVTHTTTAGCYQRITTSGATGISRIDRTVGGDAIKIASRQQFDSFRPNWQQDTGTKIQNWFSDETDPLAFWIYPAVGAGVSLEGHVLIAPTDLASLTEIATPFDQYMSALVNYVCARALSKEDEDGSAAKAQAYLQLFTSALA